MEERHKKVINSIVSLALSKLVVVLFFIALIVYSILYYQNNMVNKAKVSTLGDANLIAKQYDAFVDDLEETAKIISVLPEVRSYDQDKCNRILAEVYRDNPKYIVVVVADKNVIPYCSSSETLAKSIVGKAYFQKAVETGKLSSGGFIIGEVAGVSLASYGYPFYDENHQLVGIVGIGLSLDAIEKFNDNLESTKNNQVAIIDANNILLSQYPKGTPGSIGRKWNDDTFIQSFSNIGKAVKLGSKDGNNMVKAFKVTKDGSAVIIVSSPVKSPLLFTRDLFLKLFRSILLIYFAAIIIAILLKFRHKIRVKKPGKNKTDK